MQGIVAVMLPPATVSIRYPVRPRPEAWLIPEGIVPEAPVHDEVAEKLKLLLKTWAARSPVPTRIARNLAVRFYAEDERIGIDPDVCVLSPPPADLDDLGSVCLWKPGHTAPTLCIEIVSLNHPNKDYVAIQDRYAALGTHELVVFDPMLSGPKSLGGPVPLQLWRRDATRSFDRIHFGAEPVYSEVLDAWLIAKGRDITIAEDRAGTRPWRDEAAEARLDAERAQADAERAQADAERAQADAERAQADAERAQADAERAQADAERERGRTRQLEVELAALRASLTPK
jgi:Putative restriction endonuclease